MQEIFILGENLILVVYYMGTFLGVKTAGA
jgi:hypothetical protein